MSEDQLQAKCVKWFDEMFPGHRKMLFAVPNGGERDKRVAAMLQSTGVKRGVSDLILVADRVHFIEMKIAGGVQSEDQEKFEMAVVERGHPYHLLFSFEDFQRLMIKILMK